MTTTGTSDQLLKWFQSCSEQHSKLFIPNSLGDPAVLDSLVKHYDWKTLKAAVDFFIRSHSEPILVMDFAVQSRKVVDRMQFELDSKARFEDIVEQTRKRMEDLS